jgi:hypothetical protein
VLEEQFLRKSGKIDFKRMALQNNRQKSANRLNQRKSILLSINQINQLKREDEDMAIKELRVQNKHMFAPVARKLGKAVDRHSRHIAQPCPSDRYFLKLLLPKAKGKEKNNHLHLTLPKNQLVSIKENLYVDKYAMSEEASNGPVIQITNKFSPRSLSNDKGSLYVKDRIENVMNEELLWKLTNVNGIGRLLRTIENKVMTGVDKRKGDGRVPFGEETFLERFTKDKEFLQNFEQKWKQKLDDEIVGKKFQDKFEYVEEFISKKRAGQFVTYIHEKEKSIVGVRSNWKSIRTSSGRSRLRRRLNVRSWTRRRTLYGRSRLRNRWRPRKRKL